MIFHGKYHILLLALLGHLFTRLGNALLQSSENTNVGPHAATPNLAPVLVRQDPNGSCKDRCKERCKGRRIKDPNNCRRCIPCPIGMKPDPTRTVCIKDDASEENDKQRKGNCPGDSVLDRKEGPQKMDVDVKDLKCAIDDEKDCKPPTVPETRPNGLENNASFKPKCLDLKEDDKTTCDADQQYTEVLIGPDGKAKRSCRPTRQYEAKKRNRWQNMKDKFRQRWNERKEERAKKDEEREARRQAIQDGNQKKEKEAGDKKKKKEKSYKCGMVTALLDGRNIKDLLPIRRDLAPREDNSNIDSYMDMTTCWFDEGFVNDDAFLDFFPQDVNVDDIGIEIDENAYLERFYEILSHIEQDFWDDHDFCKRESSRTLDARCTRRIRDVLTVKELEHENLRARAAMVLKKDFLERPIEKREDSTNPEDVCDMGNMAKRDIRGVEAVQKRNPFLLIAELASFAARLGGSILARTLPNLARYSPRLAQLLKTPKNLFKLAPKSQGTGNAGGREAMRKAFQKLSDREIYKTCIKKGKP